MKLPEQFVRTAVRVGAFILAAPVLLWALGWAFVPSFGPLVGSAIAAFIAAALLNAGAMHIYERATLGDTGMGWSRASVRNLLLGLAGGIVGAAIVVVGPVLEGAAEFVPSPDPSAGLPSVATMLVVLLFGGIGEELLFHGYAFQILMRALGPFATILPVSVLFAWAHTGNPDASRLGIVNTGLWGVLLGYAFFRSGDLWLPIGLHVGWNWSLPLLGVNLSGFTMNVTGYVVHWKTADLWSGGGYGPEGALTTSVIVVLLFAWLAFKAPVLRQTPFLLRDKWEEM
jgi:membrane protease YdiL (CAAX protease family)